MLVGWVPDAKALAYFNGILLEESPLWGSLCPELVEEINRWLCIPIFQCTARGNLCLKNQVHVVINFEDEKQSFCMDSYPPPLGHGIMVNGPEGGPMELFYTVPYLEFDGKDVTETFLFTFLN